MAKKVTTYQFSKRFKKEYNKLPKEIQKAFDQKLQLLLQEMFHPSLRVKRISIRHTASGMISSSYNSRRRPSLPIRARLIKGEALHTIFIIDQVLPV